MRAAVAVERVDALLLGLRVAVDAFFGAQLQRVGLPAERVEGFGSLAGEQPDQVAVGAGGERELKSLGLPRQRLAVSSDVGVGDARSLVQPRVVRIVALGP